MDSNEITALAAMISAFMAFVLVVCGIIIAFFQARQNRKILTANSIMNLNERYLSESMKRIRMDLSQSILDKKEFVSEDLLRIFESIGNMTRKNVLDIQMIWNDYSRDIIFYYMSLRGYNRDYLKQMIIETRDETLYSEFIWLYNKMVSIEKKKRNGSSALINPNISELETFLRKETRLIENPSLARI